MTTSMTGFGRGIIDAPFGRLIVEIQSLNRKFFEVNTTLPKELSRFENEIRKWVAEKVQRGQITVRVQWIPSSEILSNLLPDVETLKSLKEAWENIAKQLKMDPNTIDLSFLIANVPSIQKNDLLKEEDLSILQKCVGDALTALLRMKNEEGKALVKDVSHRLKMLQKMVSSIEALAPAAIEKMRQKLQEKMKSLLPQDPSLDDRIMKEAAFFAEKIDISEEITRLKSHFVQFAESLLVKGSIGRKLEFIIQEMSRETNTIGSKSADAQISNLVVDMKSEIEKIREQSQNIE
ncbi:MAG TPA: YicC/YloC family endoribonuclease [Chlamydiales bacterium]|nr:YicC/YloC family endoribonuclease [Chlamydiales bacterium]